MKDPQQKCPAGRFSSPHEAPDDPGLAVLLTSIFRAWGQAEIAFVVLRNYEDLPSATANDVDVLLSPAQFELAGRVMIQAANSCGYRLHNRVEFATVSFFFHHPESLKQIQIDLFTSTRWHCFDLLSTSDVLDRRQNRPLFSIPHPVDEAIISLLARLIYQGQVKEKYRDHISRAFGEDRGMAERLLSGAFGARQSHLIVDAAVRKDWAQLESLADALRRSLLLRSFLLAPVRTILAVAGDIARFFRRLFSPGGMVVVVLGADGSGKSTVSKQMVENVRNTFNPGKMLEVHWKPVVFLKGKRKGTGKPVVDPHGKPARGRLVSLAYFAFHWIEYMIGSHVTFRKTTFRNGLVLVDRYYYDFLVDQRRYRLTVPKWVIQFAGAFMKPPDLVFLCDAPPEVLQSRKQEVPLAETARQVEIYRKIVSRLKCGMVLDATQPIPAVANEMTRVLLTAMTERLPQLNGKGETHQS